MHQLSAIAESRTNHTTCPMSGIGPEAAASGESDLRVLILEEVYGGDNSIGFGADTVARSKHGEKHGRKHGETKLKAWWKPSGKPSGKSSGKPSGKPGGKPGGNPDRKHGYRIRPSELFRINVQNSRISQQN